MATKVSSDFAVKIMKIILKFDRFSRYTAFYMTKMATSRIIYYWTTIGEMTLNEEKLMYSSLANWLI